ncbi:MAG: hypothetical protein ABI425_05295 [Patescibacteria group bacterium]
MIETTHEPSPANEEKKDVDHPFSTQAIQKRFDQYRSLPPQHIREKIRVRYLGKAGEELQEYLESKVESDKLIIVKPLLHFEDFLERYELNGKNFPEDLLREAYIDLSKDLKRVQRFVYWSFTLKESINLLLEELPEMRELCRQLEPTVSFLDADELNEDDFDEYPYAGGAIGSGNINLIVVPKFKNYEEINTYQMLRTFVFVHEFFHIINSFYAKENFGFSHSEDSITEKHRIFTTLLEGTSISLEYLLLKRLARLPDNDQLENVKKYGIWRLNNVLKLAKYRGEKARTTVTEYWNGEEGAGENYYEDKKTEPVYNFPHLNYSEGAKLGIQLQRNGWTAHDIPELWKKIKMIIDELISEKKISPAFSGSKPFDIYTELAQYGKFATWSNLKERLLQLRPERSNETIENKFE